MEFNIESTMYEKNILSDLQGAWSIFRQAVVEKAGFKGWEKVLFHTDEAMSWEVVKNLRLMLPLVIIIRNICNQGDAPDEIIEALNDIHELLEETLEEYPS